MQAGPLTLELDSPGATARLARCLAPLLRAGDVLLLHGPIGAGKTHFARNLIQALLPVPEDVPSPTYTLVQSYDGPGFEIWHADLYRLGSTAEIEELGLTDAFQDALCLVEWPERLGDLAPAGAAHLHFSPDPADPERRLLRIDWADARLAQLHEAGLV